MDISRSPSANPSSITLTLKAIALAFRFVTGHSHGKAVNITIHIEEGERFHMGTLKIVSSDPDKALSLKVDALKAAFPSNKAISSPRKKCARLWKPTGNLRRIWIHRFHLRAGHRS